LNDIKNLRMIQVMLTVMITVGDFFIRPVLVYELSVNEGHYTRLLTVVVVLWYRLTDRMTTAITETAVEKI